MLQNIATWKQAHHEHPMATELRAAIDFFDQIG
jgi:hypothetical protein